MLSSKISEEVKSSKVAFIVLVKGLTHRHQNSSQDCRDQCCLKPVPWDTEGLAVARWAGRAHLCLSLQHAYLLKLKVMYTVGYSASLAMLLVALSILCSFR